MTAPADAAPGPTPDVPAPRGSPRRVLARPEDLHCVVYHALTVAAYALAFWLWLHPAASGLDTAGARTVFAATAIPLLGWISGIDLGVNYHNHTHRPIFTRRWMNRWFARLWTPVAGWPPLWWAHVHVTVHHAHLLEDCDWTLPKKDAAGRHESSLSYQLRHWPWRTARHFARDLRSGRFDRRRALVDLAWFLPIWSIPFWIDPAMALWLWVLPQCFANIVTLNRGMYVQHAGCEAYPADPAARHSNDFLQPFFNRTMFHIGYHGTHHDFPWVHWADLPAHHRQVDSARAVTAAGAAPAAAPPSRTS